MRHLYKTFLFLCGFPFVILGFAWSVVAGSFMAGEQLSQEAASWARGSNADDLPY